MSRSWGKKRHLDEPYPLVHHLLDAAAAAIVLWDAHLSAGMRRWISAELEMNEAEARAFVALLAGLHDLGKAIQCFFEQSPRPEAPGWIRHDVASQLVVPRLLSPSGDVGALSPEYRIAQILGGHHGRFHSGWEREASDPVRRESRLGGQEWHSKRAEIFEAIRDALGRPRIPEYVPVPAAGVLTGVVILSDWLASDTDTFIPNQQRDAPAELPVRLAFTVDRLRGVVASSGLAAPAFADVVSMQATWQVEPYPLQQSISEEFAPRATEPGLLVITDSTGGGKTEAAYLGAHAQGAATGRPGIGMFLPTRATSDQAWARLRDFTSRAAVGSQPVTLAHAMATLNAVYREDEDVTEFLRPLNRTLLAGLCAGTVDQALLAALAAPFNMLRMHGLANKTVVIDEAHSYDPYMQGLLSALLSWCGRLDVPVVLLSATLPSHISHSLATAYLRGAGYEGAVDFEVAYPGWGFVGVSGRTLLPSQPALQRMARFGERTVRVYRHAHDRSHASRWKIIRGYVNRVSDQGGCLAIVCNTVDSAQRTYDDLARVFADDVLLVLLHARFPQQQRESITNEVVAHFGKKGKRPTRAVVVATQVIEQSLDLDFDLVISDIAPISLLVQRVGRCWRFTVDSEGHPIPRPEWAVGPALVVLDPVQLDSTVPTPPEWDTIYPSFEVAATHQVLVDGPTEWAVPGAVPGIVRQVHDAQAEGVPARLRALWDQQYGERRAQTQLARMAAIEPAETITDLAGLTDPDVSEIDASTRLGVDTTRVVPQYTSPDGQHWLDADHHVKWRSSRPEPEDVEQIINASITCPQSWVKAEGLQTNPKWARTQMLRDAYILPAPTCGALSVNSNHGLVRHRKEKS